MNRQCQTIGCLNDATTTYRKADGKLGYRCTACHTRVKAPALASKKTRSKGGSK